MTDGSRLEAEVAVRWQAMLAAVAAGEDIPPGQRWRTEGMMEALALLGERSEDDLQLAMADAYREALGRSLEEDVGGNWRRDFPFPEIPFFMQRAPVHRGATD